MYTTRVNKRMKYKRRLEAGLILCALRKQMKLKELERKTGIPLSLISRYSTGDILPGERHVEAIERLLLDEGIIRDILSDYKDVRGKLAIGHRLASDPLILWVAAKTISHRLKYQGFSFNTILTPEVGGIPIGVALSQLSHTRLVIARRKRYLNWKKAIAGVGGSAEHIKVYYIDESELGDADAEILLLDDIIVEGDTMESLIDLVSNSGHRVCCMYSVYGIGEKWKHRFPRMKVLAEVESRS
jgi:adenine/guanine phosphoribosyltransferase-like PRPP-binding protein